MKKSAFRKWSVMLLCCFGITAIQAQFTQTSKIISTERESRAEYGTSVAINENIAAVGAPRENIASGAAYLYNRDGEGNWSFTQKLTADDPNEGAEYGGGMKMTDNYLVVAAGRADVNGIIRAGALYIYSHPDNAWELDTKLTASDMSVDAKMGMNPTSLDAEGNTIVAGAPGDNEWTGSVYVFTNENGTWSESQKITSPDPHPSDTFGIGVSLSGNYLMIGANEFDARKGAVFVYKKNNGGLWEYNQTLMASDATADAFFGSSVSVSGNQMIIGAYGENGEQGAAYIFEQNDEDGSWQEVQKLTGGSSGDVAQYGWSTAIRENYVLVSSPHAYGTELGGVFAYSRNEDGEWNQVQLIEGNDTAAEDFYGWSIAMQGDQLIVGSPWEDHDENGENEIDRAGSAYIFSNPLLELHQAESNDKKLTIYPNPAKGYIHFASTGKNINKISLFNSAGSLIKEIEESGKHLSMNISFLPKGVYFVKIKWEDGSVTTGKINKL